MYFREKSHEYDSVTFYLKKKIKLGEVIAQDKKIDVISLTC